MLLADFGRSKTSPMLCIGDRVRFWGVIDCVDI